VAWSRRERALFHVTLGTQGSRKNIELRENWRNGPTSVRGGSWCRAGPVGQKKQEKKVLDQPGRRAGTREKKGRQKYRQKGQLDQNIERKHTKQTTRREGTLEKPGKQRGKWGQKSLTSSRERVGESNKGNKTLAKSGGNQTNVKKGRKWKRSAKTKTRSQQT